MAANMLVRQTCLRPLPRQTALQSMRVFHSATQQKASLASGDGYHYESNKWARGDVLPADGTYIKGTVNDPTTYPPPQKMSGSLHWTFERVLSAALVPVVGATAVVSPNPVLDGILAVSIVLHSHLGYDQIGLDYLHKRKHPVAWPIFVWGTRIASVATLVGIYQLNTNDIGCTELIKRLWHA